MKNVAAVVLIVLISCNFVLAGQAGNALSFDGTNDYVHAPYVSGYSGTAFTYEAWITTNIDNSQSYTRVIAGQGEDSSTDIQGPTVYVGPANNNWGKGYSVLYEDDYDNEYFVQTNNYPQINQWTHVAATRDNSGQVSIYVNGSLMGQWDSSLSPSAFCQQELTIGAIWQNQGPMVLGNFWSGAIDEVRVWNVARTGSEIAANYNRTINPATAGLIGYWNFDEGTGSIAHDLTGNGSATLGLNGTGNDMPAWITSSAPIVPEPASALLLLSGAAIIRYRRK